MVSQPVVYDLLCRKNKIPPRILTNNSVTGKASHTPVMPNRKDRKNAIGIMTKNPRKSEMTCAGWANSVEVKYTDRIILNPAKTHAVK